MAAPDLARDRATGCLLGLVAGDSLGGLVEFQTPARIAAAYPGGVRDLADGGTWDILAGQPTDDGELALALARVLAVSPTWDEEAVAAAYRRWLDSNPFDCGRTTATAFRAVGAGPGAVARTMRGLANSDSQANGSLMRVAPVGLWARNPAEAAAVAMEDSRLSHPHPVCLSACAAFVAAIASAVAGGDRAAMQSAAEDAATAPAVRQVLAEAQGGAGVADAVAQMGWVMHALRNAFFQLWHAADTEAALVATVALGGDTHTNAAICGALLGAAGGTGALPARWTSAVLACRPVAERGAKRPRPAEYWPVDIPQLAARLVQRRFTVPS